MGKKSAAVDDYILGANDFAKPILMYLRDLIHKVCPGVEETIKWRFPFFTIDGKNLCALQAFKAHCNFTFWLGKYMEDKAGIFTVMEKGSMGGFSHIKSLDELPKEKVIVSYIEQAIKLSKSEVKRNKATPKKKKTSIVVKAPAELIAALNKNKKAKKCWDDFSPSKRRDYIKWIVEAKRESTKEKRLDTTITQLAEGKSRNWKYEIK